jgi:16S rRNA pseudouridine516 synthase
MRLDRYLCELNIGTRSQVKEFIKKGLVSVNGKAIRLADYRIEEQTDQIAFQGKTLTYRKYVYYMLNKPQGVVSATQDNTAGTVTELLAAEGRKDLFPVGRLDKDTEGLLLLTNDGELAHRLLSPKKHVDKTYLVTVAHSLSEEDIRRLEQGVDIGEDRITLPAKVAVQSECMIHLTIQEGKYHQVKRMLQAVDNQVTALKRIRFGKIILDEGLAPGAYRPLTTQEEKELHES